MWPDTLLDSVKGLRNISLVERNEGADDPTASHSMRTKVLSQAIAQYGAYAQFSVEPVITVYRIPDEISFEEAATFPFSVATAALGSFIQLGTTEPGPSFTPPTSTTSAVSGEAANCICIAMFSIFRYWS